MYKKLIKVAHIDDDESYRFILKQFLNKISPKTYDIHSFESANEAFFEINSNPDYDIIISDYDMPDLNGLEVFNDLRNSGINIPFILLTGTRHNDVPSKAITDGVKFFLHKDTDILSLLKQLDQLIKVTVRQNNAGQ